MEKDKLWTKNFLLMILSTFLVTFCFYLLMTTMAVYTIEQFQSTESIAGFVASIFIVGALISRIFTGKLIVYAGRKRLLYWSMSLFLIASVGYLFVDQLFLLFILRLIHGASFGTVSTILTTIALDGLPTNRRGEGTGIFSLSATIATALGPFLALFLTTNYSYDVLFISCIIFSVLALIICILSKIVDLDLPNMTHERKKVQINDFIDTSVLPISLVMFVAGIAYTSIISFINSFAIEADLTSVASLFFIVYSFFVFISRPVGGKIFDAKGGNIVVYPSIIFYSVSLMLIALSNNSIIFLLAGVFLAFGYGTLFSSIQTIVTQLIPKERLGIAISTFFICADAGIGFGAFFVGLIVESFGYQIMYFIIALLILCLVPYYGFVHGNKSKLLPK